MNILTKHKKKGEEGFRKFVCNLETSTEIRQREILEVAFLEDPVYTSAIIPNMLTADYIVKLQETEILKVYNNINNPINIFLYAFFETKCEDMLINDLLPKNLKRMYDDEKEVTTEVRPGEQSAARFTIIKTIRQLQNAYEIDRFKWSMPSDKVLNGNHIELPRDGLFTLIYEDKNIPALEGSVKARQREGKWYHYYPNGKVMARGHYKDGEKVGEWMFNFTNGQKKSTGEYEDNLKQGQWIIYDKEGMEKFTFYERGKVR